MWVAPVNVSQDCIRQTRNESGSIGLPHAVYSRTAFCAFFADRESRGFNNLRVFEVLWLDSPASTNVSGVVSIY